MTSQSIGGYFGLELQPHPNYLHHSLIHLNSARNCFEYILIARKYKKIYIPYYTCDVILEPLHKLNIKYDFYDVDNNLEPLFDYDIIKQDEGFLLNDYFGIKTSFVKKVSSKIRNLIIDNAQALFATPIESIDTFYSPRKFIGASDGGFLSTNLYLNATFEKDQSYKRFSHLLQRIDLSAEDGYNDYQENEKLMKNQPIKIMSNLTREILAGTDYELIKQQREKNFNFLHKALREKNILSIEIDSDSVPLVYPYRTSNNDLRNKLINENIYCVQYWPNVLESVRKDKNSYFLAEEIIGLPLDQRYTNKEMECILNVIFAENNMNTNNKI